MPRQVVTPCIVLRTTEETEGTELDFAAHRVNSAACCVRLPSVLGNLYTSAMPILKDIAAIAKGMSITFKEMFQPTIVENYPDGPGPLKGAKFQERYRGVHVLQRDENGLEKCVACFLRRRLSLKLYLHRSRGEYDGESNLGGGALRQGL